MIEDGFVTTPDLYRRGVVGSIERYKAEGVPVVVWRPNTVKRSQAELIAIMAEFDQIIAEELNFDLNRPDRFEDMDPYQCFYSGQVQGIGARVRLYFYSSDVINEEVCRCPAGLGSIWSFPPQRSPIDLGSI